MAIHLPPRPAPGRGSRRRVPGVRVAGAAIACLALTGCPGGGGDDDTPPTVTGFTPSAGAEGVPLSTVITATFSEAMDAASISTASFQLALNPPVAGAVAYDAATRTASFIPSTALPGESELTATITTGARDAAGNALAAETSWTFTTKAAPAVTTFDPATGTTRVLTNSTVEATFSQAMDPATLTTASFQVGAGSTLAGAVDYDAATLTATFTPTDDLPPGTELTATVTTGAQDEAGDGLAADATSTFTTEAFIERVSVDSAGAEGNGDSEDCEHCSPVSADGRYVVFTSVASNLVVGDTNGQRDAFRHDWQTGTTIRVSLPDAALGGESVVDVEDDVSVSADGRYVAFASEGADLVAGDTNNRIDLFVHDTETGATTRVSVPHDPDRGTLGAEADDDSLRGSLSADARYVVFQSAATNLVVADSNGQTDVFVHDRQSITTTRVSVVSGGNQANGGASSNASISADGRYVAFESRAVNLDTVTSDTNGVADVFVHDTQSGATTRVSVASDGSEATGGSSLNPAISADGRYVAFWSFATNLVAGDTNSTQDIFVHDRLNGTTTRVSVPDLAGQGTLGTQADGESQYPAISGDGRYVAFGSLATNLVAGDDNGVYDVFVHDTRTGLTRRVSVAGDGTQGDGETSDWASLSADGRYVVFNADSANLVSGDGNGASDVFRALNATVP